MITFSYVIIVNRQHQMKLEQLKVIQAIVETGTVKAASEALNKTQPAISQALKSLELQIGANLFDRSGYRLELTSLGKRVYLQSLRVLAETDDLSQLIQHFEKGNEEQITLAVDANVDIKKLTFVLLELQQQFPESKVIILTEVLSGTVKLVKTGIADIAIAPMYPVLLEEEGFDYTPLYTSYMRNVATPQLVSLMSNANKVSDLRRFHQILVSDSGNKDGVFERDFGVQKGQRCWHVSDINMKKKLLMSNLGWGRLPEHMINEELIEAKLEEIVLPNTHLKLEFSVYAFRSSTPIKGPVASYIWSSLKNYI